MKVAFLGDLHFGVRNDSEVFYRIQKQFFEETFFPTLKKLGIKKVVQVGDFFDRRQYINFKTLHFLKSFLPQLLADNDVMMYVLIGNHDVALKSSNHINSPSLLLTDIPQIKTIDTLSEVTMTEDDEVFNLAILPWINNSNYKETLEFIQKTDCQYMAGHLELAGFEMHRGHVNTDGMDPGIFDKFLKVITGHFHTKADVGNILYTGTPYEMSWSDWNDKKGFWVLDTNTHKIDFIPNEVSTFHRMEYWNTNGKEFIKVEPPTDSIKDKYVKLICVKKEDEYMFEQFLKKKLVEQPTDLNVVLSSIEMNEDMEAAVEGASKTLTQLIVDNINTIDLPDSVAHQEELKKDTISLLLSIHTEIGGKD